MEKVVKPSTLKKQELVEFVDDRLTRINTVLVEAERKLRRIKELDETVERADDEHEGLLSKVKQIKRDLEATSLSAQDSAQVIDALYERLFEGNEKTPAIKDSIEKYENKVRLLELEVFGDSEGLYQGEVALRPQYLSELKALKSSSEHARKALAEISDLGLHGAFSKRANTSSVAYHLYQVALLAILFLLAAVGYQLVQSDITLENFVMKTITAIPLGFAAFLLNRTAKVEKKISEDYRHKSALTEALAGYRNLYNLSNSDDEYMELFEHVKMDLVTNPSDRMEQILGRLVPGENGLLSILNRGSQKPSDSAAKLRKAKALSNNAEKDSQTNGLMQTEVTNEAANAEVESEAQP